MRLTVLGGCGGWPAAGLACSGYLVEHDGFRLLIDPGYAIVPRLLEVTDAAAVDAVLVSHGHPDHCADLNPLLRARAMTDEPPSALPVFAPHGALGPVLALDRPGMLDDAIALREFTPGDGLEVGPFGVSSWLLPHWMPNAGLRLEADGEVLAYTGDSGPSPLLADLARGAGIFLAEARAGRLVLTHLWPGTDSDEAVRAAAGSYPGEIAVASPGLVTEPGLR